MSHGASASRDAPRSRRATDQKRSGRTSSRSVLSRSASTGIGYHRLPFHPHSEVTSSISAPRRHLFTNTESGNFLESPQTEREISRTGRGRGSRTVTPAERAQAHQLSLRRIAALFPPHRWPLALVTAVIVASSLAGLASPFLLRAAIDTALP